METEGSLPHLQAATSCSYPEPEYGYITTAITLRNSVFSMRVYLCVSRDSTKNSHNFPKKH